MALSNLQILQKMASEKSLSTEFLARIPEITQQNLAQIGVTMTNYPVIANEFVQALTNQIARTLFMTKTLDNPLAMFEKGDLEKFGKSLEMIYVDVITGKDFTDRFGGSYSEELNAPEKVTNVKVQYLTENSRIKYKVTISSDMLASAFKSDNGLSSMLNQQVSKMSESYNVDKFLMTWKLLDYMTTNKVVGVKPTDNASAKQFTTQVKQIVKNMRFPSRDYNASGVMTKSMSEELYIIVDTETSAILDVELLATAFNISKVELEGRIVEVPNFGDPKRVAIIMDRDKLQIFQTKMASDSEKNGAGLFTNIFMHRWDLFGACDFANCVEIRTDLAKSELRDMPYDVIKYGAKNVDGTERADLKSTEIEILSDGTIGAKTEKILNEEANKSKEKLKLPLDK